MPVPPSQRPIPSYTSLLSTASLAFLSFSPLLGSDSTDRASLESKSMFEFLAGMKAEGSPRRVFAFFPHARRFMRTVGPNGGKRDGHTPATWDIAWGMDAAAAAAAAYNPTSDNPPAGQSPSLHAGTRWAGHTHAIQDAAPVATIPRCHRRTGCRCSARR